MNTLNIQSECEYDDDGNRTEKKTENKNIKKTHIKYITYELIE